MTRGYAKKRSDDDLGKQFMEGAREARDFLETVDEELRIVLPAWDVWLSIEDLHLLDWAAADLPIVEKLLS